MTKALKGEEALAERMPWQRFVTKCPEWGGQLYLSGYSTMLDKRLAIYPDGFDVGGGEAQHTDDAREWLQEAAATIAGFYGKAPARPLQALARLIVAPHWVRPGVRRWRGGELIAWLRTLRSVEAGKAWGDVGYYVAQTWGWLWCLYQAVTDRALIAETVARHEERARQ